MGSNQNITLPSTFTTPTSGQLGYTQTGTLTASTSLVSTGQQQFANISLGVGTWMLIARCGVVTGGSASTISTIVAGFTNGNPSSASSYTFGDTIAKTIPASSASTVINITSVVNITSATTYYFYGYFVFTNALTLTAFNATVPTVFTATRIA